MIKNIQNIGSYQSCKNLQQKPKNNANIPCNNNTVAFTGTKTNVLAGVASGLLVGYYALAGIFVPPSVQQQINMTKVRNFEYEVAESFINESPQEDEQDKLIEDTLKLMEKHPEQPVTKGCLSLLTKYEIITDKNNAALIDALNSLIADKTLDKTSKKFYIEYLDSISGTQE